MRQGVSANSVAVGATGTSEVNDRITAGVSGGVKGKSSENGSSGSTDRQTDKILKGAANLADKNQAGSVSGDKVNRLTTDRQQAQTSEGSVAGAGAVAVNVMENRASARIADDADVIASGKLSVTSVNRTVAKVMANASTTKSDKGVGVGVGVNIVNIENIAAIGKGLIEAGELEVLARMPVVPNGIITFPWKSLASMKVLMMVGAVYHQMGNPT